MQHLGHGCINCEAISPSSGPFRFLADNVYLCEECMDDPAIVKVMKEHVQLYQDVCNYDATEYAE